MSGNLCRCGAYVGNLRRDPRGVRIRGESFWGNSMKNFAYFASKKTVEGAVGMIARKRQCEVSGRGGRNLVDLMRENIEQPDAVVDVNASL